MAEQHNSKNRGNGHEQWVYAAPAGEGYPADLVPYRQAITNCFDDLRAAAGLDACSAAAARRRRRLADNSLLARWLYFVDVRGYLPTEGRPGQVTRAMKMRVQGRCVHCDGNLCVHPLKVINGLWRVCGVCGRRASTDVPGAGAVWDETSVVEERFKGWVPW